VSLRYVDVRILPSTKEYNSAVRHTVTVKVRVESAAGAT
jgi:hypothetical protein